MEMSLRSHYVNSCNESNKELINSWKCAFILGYFTWNQSRDANWEYTCEVYAPHVHNMWKCIMTRYYRKDLDVSNRRPPPPPACGDSEAEANM